MTADSRAKILVVDDEPDCVLFATTVMEEAGFEALSAANGVEGLEKARAEKPDLVILDIQMPEKDGFATLVDIRKIPELAETPIVMLTGITERIGIKYSPDDMAEYFGVKPDAYVEKPINPEALQETVKGLLAK